MSHVHLNAVLLRYLNRSIVRIALHLFRDGGAGGEDARVPAGDED